jgi:hypothetical protein
MRQRDDSSDSGKMVVSSVTDMLSRTTERPTEQVPGQQGEPVEQRRIPSQKSPTHETVEKPEVIVGADASENSNSATKAQDHPSAASKASALIPATAQWRAGHTPRIFAAALLLLAVGGTSALGLRYAETRSPDEFLSVVLGLAVVVGLWGLLIASTPQVVSLRGSVLTVRNSSGTERFDLGDGLQPVDLIGQPRGSGWALLLHRSNNTSVVLRRRDVDAVTLDPIVRHYRALAQQRFSDRQVRFNR